VLDHVQRGRFLVEPAGEDTLELTLRIANIELKKGAGELLDLPRRGRLAGAQPHDHVVADPNGLPRPELQIAGDAVALVEEADHRRPLWHRRRAGRHLRHGLRNVDGFGLRLGRGLTGLLGFGYIAPVAGAEREQGKEGPDGPSARGHAYSGVHAS
jgi:hypothetical protein